MPARITRRAVAIAAVALAAAPVAAIAAISLTAADAAPAPSAAPAAAATAARSTTVTVRIAGGHATAAHDHGRPVVLVAAALGVPTAVFRTAFDGVTPAAAGDAPDPAQVQANKAALLQVLAPYGVTNERLDAVSDHYRFQGSAGETWPREAASATAVVRGGKVVSITLLDGGSGYSSTPRVTVPGVPGATIRVTLHHGTDFATNGAIERLTVATS
jgi:hypothetical protein